MHGCNNKCVDGYTYRHMCIGVGTEIPAKSHTLYHTFCKADWKFNDDGDTGMLQVQSLFTIPLGLFVAC